MKRLVVIMVAAMLLLTGSLGVSYGTSEGSAGVGSADARYGEKEEGSDAGEDDTNATASVAGTLESTTTEVLYLNNTSPDHPLYVRFILEDTTLLSNLVELKIGIDNGTRHEQIVVSLGSILQGTGDHVRLDPGSTNTIYVTRAVNDLGLESGVRFVARAADDPSENAYVKTRGRVKVM